MSLLYTCTHICTKMLFFFPQRASQQNSQHKLKGKFQVQAEWNSHVMSCSLLVVQPSPSFSSFSRLPLSLFLTQSSRPPSFPFFHTHCSPEFHSDWSVSVSGEYFCLLPSPCHIPASRAQRPPDMGYKEKHSSSMHLHSALWPPFAISEFFELFWIGKQTLQESLPSLLWDLLDLYGFSFVQKAHLCTAEYSNETASAQMCAWTEYNGWVWVELCDGHIAIVGLLIKQNWTVTLIECLLNHLIWYTNKNSFIY